VISVEEALAIMLRETPSLGGEDVLLEGSLGRILAEAVRADADQPPFDRAAMDGYALRAEDAARTAAVLKVVGEVRAGQVPERSVGAGEAMQIMTGAPLPRGASAVQPVEKTRRLEADRVAIDSVVEPRQHIAPRGSEMRAGDVVLEGGAPIDPATIALLASVGRSRVRVGQRPRVAVLATGDELVPVSETPGPGRIRNSNGPAVLAQARWAGAHVRSLGIVSDDGAALTEAIDNGLDGDVLVVSGGVSAGAYDLVEAAFARVGVEVFFERVAIKPGAPLVFGRRKRVLVFGLPGNPVSAQVTFDVFVRAALLRLQGARCVSRPQVEVELLGPLRNKSGRKAHLPARVRWEAGRLVAEPLPSMGSADILAHARANALVVLDRARTAAAMGERAPALLLGNFLERDGASLP
jgi:molybdenum cofactor synthesis domain-containing protein